MKEEIHNLIIGLGLCVGIAVVWLRFEPTNGWQSAGIFTYGPIIVVIGLILIFGSAGPLHQRLKERRKKAN